MKTTASSGNDPFVQYYSQQSEGPVTLARFAATRDQVMRAARHFGLPAGAQKVADIGCGAATQCAMWARDGHQVHGVDINESLIQIGRERAAAQQLSISLQSGSATSLPWADGAFDIVLCPELLEHVADWESVLKEAVRVTRPGGVLYVSTTNRLCPVQAEFTLPAYSWYPGPLKRYYERLSVTTRPELVNHAKYPAVHWFTYFQLKRFLAARGMQCMDRFDVTALSDHGAAGNAVLTLLRKVPGLRLAGHVLTPYTVVFARRAG
jgi:2-polyprenyl-6-hydroxyphenyl methylase/3-demethylubiquinone-9 3-methyltransferase